MSHSKHAVVVAYLALFVALGGTATALTGRNTVKSNDIAPKNVRHGDIGTDAVKARNVAALTELEIAESTSAGRGIMFGGEISDSALFRNAQGRLQSTVPLAVGAEGGPTSALGGNFLTVPAGFIRTTETTVDPLVLGNEATLFVRDSGAGKTQLVVKFGSGATQVIEVEP